MIKSMEAVGTRITWLLIAGFVVIGGVMGYRAFLSGGVRHPFEFCRFSVVAAETHSIEVFSPFDRPHGLLLHEVEQVEHPILAAMKTTLAETNKPSESPEADIRMYDADGRRYDYPYFINAGAIEDPVAKVYLSLPRATAATISALVRKRHVIGRDVIDQIERSN